MPSLVSQSVKSNNYISLTHQASSRTFSAAFSLMQFLADIPHLISWQNGSPDIHRKDKIQIIRVTEDWVDVKHNCCRNNSAEGCARHQVLRKAPLRGLFFFEREMNYPIGVASR